MKLTIDNLDGHGPHDYTPAIDRLRPPQVVRRLNKPSELRLSLVADEPDFVVPVNGAWVMLGKSNGQDVFTGYLAAAPEFEYLGWGERGPVYRYNLVATSDEILLDQKRLPNRPPFVERSAGEALRQLTESVLPGVFDTSQIEDGETMLWYAPDPQKNWSEHAAQIALQVRSCYRTLNGAVIFSSVGTTVHMLDENAADFSPEGLKLQPVARLVNDITMVGRAEPQDYVKDYFVGDGFTLRFYLSQSPFTPIIRTLVDEEYKNSALDPIWWTVSDPAHVVSVSGGKLAVAGGTGTDGQTTVCFMEKIELGAAVVLQHGDATFSAASDGVVGGLYAGGITVGGCLAGFRITPSGSQSKIQALVNGAVTGPVINTQSGHHYSFTTRFYATEIKRWQETFHSSTHPAGHGRGGAAIAADVRFVLEVHDTDPTDPGSMVTPSAVLYDGVIGNAAGSCTYALVNSRSLHMAIAFTRFLQAVAAEVRSALPQESYRTRLVGSLVDGGECLVTQDPALQFFPQAAPAADELIEVHYRSSQRSLGRINDPVNIAAHKLGGDDGVRGAVKYVLAPAPRSWADCENSALALLDDAKAIAWAGEYETWSDFLPGAAQDIFPGDGLAVSAPSRQADFQAIVREVEIAVMDPAGDRSRYKIRFADDAAASLSLALEPGRVTNLMDITATSITASGSNFLASLRAAAITGVTSTTVTVDAGTSPPAGGGFEVRRSDSGWGQANDRNLIGRFGTRSFTLSRLARVQDYFLRQYDNSNPAKYSRYSAALHIDYPL